MLEEIMRYINNYFIYRNDYMEIVSFGGEYTIENGSISLPFVVDGQYFKIEGSVLNDGVYSYPCNELLDETFTGRIFPLKVPRTFLDLVDEIEAWQTEYGSKTASPLQSESFDGYSYSRATGTDGNNISWQNAFGARLNIWSKRL